MSSIILCRVCHLAVKGNQAFQLLLVLIYGPVGNIVRRGPIVRVVGMMVVISVMLVIVMSR